MGSVRVLVVTVSDSVSAGKSQDRSGPEIQQILQHHGYQDISTTVLPDDEAQIRQTVQDHAERAAADWIVTTGGTGFGVRDRTPEAISPLIERHAPGIVHLLLSASIKHTPLAALSRPIAGTVKNTLVVTLPGSVKAVRENLEALLANGVVAHAIDLIQGGTGNQVHTALGSSHTPAQAASASDGHHHHHHHHDDDHVAPRPRTLLSHDPSAPAPGRLRKSPYPQISLDAALALILTEIRPLGPLQRPVDSTLAGHVLAEDVYAPQNVPSSQTTNVDGYALRSSDPPGVYNVLTWKTHAPAEDVPRGFIFRVNTGGPLPAGTDAVIMVEDTELVSTVSHGDDLEERQVRTLVQVPKGDNVRLPGSDVRTGDLVLQKDELITSLGGEIGTLAFVGRREVKVGRKPIVAILSTGNEILDLQSPTPLPGDGWGGIYDTNRPSLRATLEGMGYTVIDIGIVPDDVDAHVQAIARGLRDADLLLTTGGTSMGSSDLLKPVLERRFEGTIHFGRVSMKPGKPTTFASVPAAPERGGERKYVFALPGNPASALVTFHVFVVPALRRLGGWPPERCQLPRVQVQIQHAMRLDPRVEFHRVVVRATLEGLKAYSTGGQRSSRVASLSGANALVQLPVLREGGPSQLQAGEWVDAVIVGEIQM